MLIDRFIQNVHTKNPVLDLEYLIRSGRHAAEFGLQWDAQSCLVLITCALGCISQPFTSSMQSPQTPRSLQEGLAWQTPGVTSSSATQLREGEAFFMMACRRIGLLHYSVIGAQCHFFAGGMLDKISQHWTREAKRTTSLFDVHIPSPVCVESLLPSVDILPAASEID